MARRFDRLQERYIPQEERVQEMLDLAADEHELAAEQPTDRLRKLATLFALATETARNRSRLPTVPDDRIDRRILEQALSRSL